MLADEILVIADGRLLQAGPSREVFRRPDSPEVARLLGVDNLLRGEAGDDGWILTGEGAARLSVLGGASFPPGTSLLWSVRPERVSVGHTGRYQATVTDVADVGTATLLRVRLLGGPDLTARTVEDVDLAAGDDCWVDFAPDDVTAWVAGPVPAALSEAAAGTE